MNYISVLTSINPHAELTIAMKPFTFEEHVSSDDEANQALEQVYRKMHQEKMAEMKKREQIRLATQEMDQKKLKQIASMMSSLSRTKYTYDYNGNILKVTAPKTRSIVWESSFKLVEDKPGSRREKSAPRPSIKDLDKAKEAKQQEVISKYQGTGHLPTNLPKKVHRMGSVDEIGDDFLEKFSKHYAKKDKKLMERLASSALAQQEAFVPVSGVSFKSEVHIQNQTKRNFEKTKPPVKFVISSDAEGNLEKRVNLQEYKNSVKDHNSRRRKVIEELANKHKAYQEYYNSLQANDTEENDTAKRLLEEARLAAQQAAKAKSKRSGTLTNLDAGSKSPEMRNAARRASMKEISPSKQVQKPKIPNVNLVSVQAQDPKNTESVLKYNTNKKLLSQLIGEKDSASLLFKTMNGFEDPIKVENPKPSYKFSTITRSKEEDKKAARLAAESIRTMSSERLKTLKGEHRKMSSTYTAPWAMVSQKRLAGPRKPTQDDFLKSIGHKPVRSKSVTRFDPTMTSTSSLWNTQFN